MIARRHESTKVATFQAWSAVCKQIQSLDTAKMVTHSSRTLQKFKETLQEKRFGATFFCLSSGGRGALAHHRHSGLKSVPRQSKSVELLLEQHKDAGSPPLQSRVGLVSTVHHAKVSKRGDGDPPDFEREEGRGVPFSEKREVGRGASSADEVLNDDVLPLCFESERAVTPVLCGAIKAQEEESLADRSQTVEGTCLHEESVRKWRPSSGHESENTTRDCMSEVSMTGGGGSLSGEIQRQEGALASPHNEIKRRESGMLPQEGSDVRRGRLTAHSEQSPDVDGAKTRSAQHVEVKKEFFGSSSGGEGAIRTVNAVENPTTDNPAIEDVTMISAEQNRWITYSSADLGDIPGRGSSPLEVSLSSTMRSAGGTLWTSIGECSLAPSGVLTRGIAHTPTGESPPVEAQESSEGFFSAFMGGVPLPLSCGPQACFYLWKQSAALSDARSRDALHRSNRRILISVVVRLWKSVVLGGGHIQRTRANACARALAVRSTKSSHIATVFWNWSEMAVYSRRECIPFR